MLQRSSKRKMKVVVILLILFCIDFVLSQGSVDIIPPDDFVSVLGGTAVFRCLTTIPSLTINNVEWLANGIPLTDVMSSFRNVSVSQRNGIGTLQFADLPLEYNNTQISCNATFSTGEVESSATTSNLKILKGLLSAVGSLMVTVQDPYFSLTWTAPTTQEDIDSRPVIEGYCVNVVNRTRDSTLTLHSQCGIMETSFDYPIPTGYNSVCHLLQFRVTPVSVGCDGIPALVELLQVQEAPEIVRVTALLDTQRVLIEMSAAVCSVKVTVLDLDTGETMTLAGNADFSIMGIITITPGLLAVNRHYNVTVEAMNAVGSANTYAALSKHDILNATSTETDAIVITTLYSEHSDARGALFDFVFIDDNGDVDFTRSVLLALDRNTSLHHTLAFNLYPGQYRVFVYDIESDGTLSNGVGYPAVTDELTLSNGQGLSFESETASCQVTLSSGVISAECTFPSDAMATGFQMIVQSSNSSKVHILHVSQSMDLQTPVTVEVEERGMYLVVIFAIREETGIIGSYVTREVLEVKGVERNKNSLSTLEIIILCVVIGGVVLLVLVLVLSVLLSIYCKKKKKRVQDSKDEVQP